MKVINATNLDRKPGVSTDLDLMRAATFMRFVITCAVCLLFLQAGHGTRERHVASNPCRPANRGG